MPWYFVVILCVAFKAPEVRQDIVVGPAGIAAQEFVPAVIVGLLAAHIDHSVYGAAAAERLGLRNDRRAPVELLLWHGLVHFEEVLAGEVFHVARRHLHQPVGAGRTAFNDQNAGVKVADQPGCGHAGSGSSSRNDIVVVQTASPGTCGHACASVIPVAGEAFFRLPPRKRKPPRGRSSGRHCHSFSAWHPGRRTASPSARRPGQRPAGLSP